MAILMRLTSSEKCELKRKSAHGHFGYWWRSRFSCLASDDFLLEPSTVFDFATSITLWACCMLAPQKEEKAKSKIELETWIWNLRSMFSFTIRHHYPNDHEPRYGSEMYVFY